MTTQSLGLNAKITVFLSACTVFLSLLPATDASAVPSYSRRYGVDCSTCHTMWGALNAAGVSFRLSGYRAIFGSDLTPTSEDMKVGGITLPTTLPLSFITGVGLDARRDKRSAAAGSATSSGSSLALEDASIFMTSPLGQHLSAFVEFPMYETKAWEFTPTGPAESRNVGASRNIKFGTESPAFEVAKFFWNNLLGNSVPRDSVNLLGGITHLPLAYSPGKVRLSVNQYLIYERTALDLISPKKVEDVLGAEPNDVLFRLSEPQGLAEVNGMLTFGAPVTEISKRETLWGEYHVGITNGSNNKAASRSQKDFYGRGVLRWYNQSLGLFAFRSGDLYGDDLRTTASLANPNGIMSGSQSANRVTRWGPDFTLSLAPMAIPVSLENQLMYNRESNPTGFGEEFKWRGGFHQLNWQISRESIAYARYDWVRGDAFNDTNRTMTVNGTPFTGITMATPKEHDYVLGWQHLYEQNIKLVAEFRRHIFEDTASGAGVAPSKLSDNGFTLRVMFGF